jgi:predicted Zn-dependent peptidase
MNNLARQEIYFGRHFDMDEILSGIEAVEARDVQRIAGAIFAGELSMSVLGNLGKYRPRPSLLRV